MRVAVLGVGLIGGSIGLAARESVADVEVVGFGRSPEKLERARELGAIDVAAGSLDEALADAAICFAARRSVCSATRSPPRSRPPARTASSPTSARSRAAWSRTPPNARFVGGHPIAGAETAGVEHARADLFDGATWYLTPTAESSGVLYERLHRFVAALGARPVAIDAETHDRLLATVSHLPHVLANVLVTQAAGTLGDDDAALPRVGPSFRDATRVAGANSAIWTDIYVANRERDRRRGRRDRRAPAGRRGAAARRRPRRDHRLERAGRRGSATGCSRRTSRPAPSTSCAPPCPTAPVSSRRWLSHSGKAGVNIVDMALAPAPDMRSGAITLWIAGDDQADRARELIDGLGFPVAEA